MMAKKEKTAIKAVHVKKKRTVEKTVLKISKTTIDITVCAETNFGVVAESAEAVMPRAYTATLGALTRLKQRDFSLIPFDDRLKVKIKELAFYNPIASPDMNQANKLATNMDFELKMRSASYKPGVTMTDAISNMESVLKDGEKTVKDLADKVDKYYIFS